ncbi:hypothetical protein [Thermocrinis sp.]|jgi:hypothetical protein|uniref:hypothetical protein n=1 Tax=Thermocrinis sp. TaxID=2024383 RepID=UPI003C127C13
MEKLRQVSIAEFLALCRMQMARGKSKFRIFLPATKLPPIKAYKTVVLEDSVVGVSLRCFASPTENGGWKIRVQVVEKPLNPLGEALEKVVKKQQ